MDSDMDAFTLFGLPLPVARGEDNDNAASDNFAFQDMINTDLLGSPVGFTGRTTGSTTADNTLGVSATAGNTSAASTTDGGATANSSMEAVGLTGSAAVSSPEDDDDSDASGTSYMVAGSTQAGSTPAASTPAGSTADDGITAEPRATADLLMDFFQGYTSGPDIPQYPFAASLDQDPFDFSLSQEYPFAAPLNMDQLGISLAPDQFPAPPNTTAAQSQAQSTQGLLTAPLALPAAPLADTAGQDQAQGAQDFFAAPLDNTAVQNQPQSFQDLLAAPLDSAPAPAHDPCLSDWLTASSYTLGAVYGLPTDTGLDDSNAAQPAAEPPNALQQPLDLPTTYGWQSADWPVENGSGLGTGLGSIGSSSVPLADAASLSQTPKFVSLSQLQVHDSLPLPLAPADPFHRMVPAPSSQSTQPQDLLGNHGPVPPQQASAESTSSSPKSTNSSPAHSDLTMPSSGTRSQNSNTPEDMARGEKKGKFSCRGYGVQKGHAKGRAVRASSIEAKKAELLVDLAQRRAYTASPICLTGPSNGAPTTAESAVQGKQPALQGPPRPDVPLPLPLPHQPPLPPRPPWFERCRPQLGPGAAAATKDTPPCQCQQKRLAGRITRSASAPASSPAPAPAWAPAPAPAPVPAAAPAPVPAAAPPPPPAPVKARTYEALASLQPLRTLDLVDTGKHNPKNDCHCLSCMGNGEAIAEGKEPSLKGIYVNCEDSAKCICDMAMRGLLGFSQERPENLAGDGAQSGHVFVYRAVPPLQRWTDGRNWTPSRKGPGRQDMFYREVERPVSFSAKRGVAVRIVTDENCHDILGVRPADVYASRHFSTPNEAARKLVRALTSNFEYKPNGLVKRGFTFETSDHDHWHVICYYKIIDVLTGALRWV